MILVVTLLNALKLLTHIYTYAYLSPNSRSFRIPNYHIEIEKL